MNKKYISLTLAIVLFTACGGSSSSKVAGEGSIDLKAYYPNASMTKTFLPVENGLNKSTHDEVITVNGQTITTEVNSVIIENMVFTDKNITTTTTEGTSTDTSLSYRHVDLGDTIISHSFKSTKPDELGEITTNFELVCKLKSKEEKYTSNGNEYSGDLLKIECIKEGEVIYDIKPALLASEFVNTDLNGSHIIYNQSYIYLKKDWGEVARIDDDCIPKDKPNEAINDKSSQCEKENSYYEFYLP
ncbi:MAG: Unknown protein [uncultured Sulfurovum sp.]|uniref:Lipoprotein n=1 Tax=uncultured Sulfurovum sp. TaxID=269237 RepID=A0A6S6SP76_9BACT|nr:MAG: Unknown protein [uncultured Sulfurovum sp.]